MRAGNQQKLFDIPKRAENGLVYRPDFITSEEEMAILEAIETLPLRKATYNEHRVKRRVMGFGWDYDFEKGRFIPGPPLPDFLLPLQRKIAKWLDIPKKRVVEALINEYTPNTSIGWHSDREKFEHIVGVSLGGWSLIRFRPLPNQKMKAKPFALELERRSAYIMQKAIRWDWQHSIQPTKTLRYSITFRTLPR